MFQSLEIKPTSSEPNYLQRQASDPKASVWVSASAGSGKTKVLTDRVLRLLLTGCEPHKIVCLTFTKAAASEMQARVKHKLKTWSELPHSELVQTLSDLTGNVVTDDIIRNALNLYKKMQAAAQPIRIQTIHAFCQSILKQFPLEANIFPQFEALDERESQQLLEEAFEEIISDLETANLTYFSKHFTFDQFYELGKMIIARKEQIENLKFTYENLKKLWQLYQKFFQCQYASVEACFEKLLAYLTHIDFIPIITILAQGTVSEQTNAEKIKLFLEDPNQHFKAIRSVFLTGKSEIKKNLLTKKTVQKAPEILHQMQLIAEELERWINVLNAHKSCIASFEYTKFAYAMISCYEQKKQEKFALDFDDLILKTAILLENSEALDWVLYKLDSGIEHLLVDEAQDTNLHQWRIIMALAKEFFSGLSAKEENRTLFVVGDEKQSIYSFQGANPRIFSEIKSHLKETVLQSGKVWRDIQLQFSFRSSAAILDIVDEVFSNAALKTAVLTSDLEVKHHAYRQDAYGKVMLSPLVRQETLAETIKAWEAPLQKNYQVTVSKLHARQIASQIKGWLETGKPLHSRKRPVEPKDIMILLRRRNHFFHEIVTALKQAGVPVAGVDRMVLNEQLCVEDLIAFGKFLLYPDDDLNLACLLKTPFVGLSESDLFELAYKRKKSLWYALKQHSTHTPIFEYLNRFLNQVDFMAPFELFQMILNQPCPTHAESGYKACLSRLGHEIEDPIDAFLNLVQFYENKYSRSLEQFVHWFGRDQSEMKRDLSQVDNAVQIMTVHGSKGLQAPIVFLPDTVSVPRQMDQVFWTPYQGQLIPLFINSVEALDTKSKQVRDYERQMQLAEYYRLFYVALTRAEDELYVSGHVGKNEPAEQSWYHIMAGVMSKLGESESSESNNSPAYSYEKGAQQVILKPCRTLENKSLKKHFPNWLYETIHDESELSEILNPSRIQPAQPKNVEQTKYYARGNFIHRLLEYLPGLSENYWPKMVALIQSEQAYNGEDIEEILKKIKKLISDPNYGNLFSDRAMVEMPLIANANGKKISAQLDRVVIDADQVLFADYKTNRTVPKEIPKAYRQQLHCYYELLSQKYPNKNIRGGILWFETLTLEIMAFD